MAFFVTGALVVSRSLMAKLSPPGPEVSTAPGRPSGGQAGMHSAGARLPRRTRLHALAD